jgi:hypothetical protein
MVYDNMQHKVTEFYFNKCCEFLVSILSIG